MNAVEKLAYKLKGFFGNFSERFVGFWKRFAKRIVSFFTRLGDSIKQFGLDFWHGNAITKGSYFLMGLGHITRGKVLQGILYMLLEVAFVLYLVLFGGSYVAMFFRHFFTGGTIGDTQTGDVWVYDPELDDYRKQTMEGDNSILVVLYGVLSVCIIVFFAILYFKSVKESAQLEQDRIIGLKPEGIKRDIGNLMDKKFHTTLLSLPMLGLFVFTVVPLITMILIAFTNFDTEHEVPKKLFSWVGFENFSEIFSSGSALGKTFWRVLGWTLIWAFFATFTNYFGGMLLAMLINRKGIKLKKLYRTLFVATIAVPQFVSLLLMSKMFDSGDDGGFITQLIQNLFGYHLQFGVDINTTRAVIIIVNMWIGIPYTMLMCSGILMNIPQDLYESAKIDGSGPVRTFFKITLPYMLFVTGPYLITTFIGNINNFNVIYLLSGGAPGNNVLYSDGAKGTDLLVTWLYKLSLNDTKNYKLASVIGILVFIISATFSLLVYNRSSSVKKEDDFQ